MILTLPVEQNNKKMEIDLFDVMKNVFCQVYFVVKSHKYTVNRGVVCQV